MIQVTFRDHHFYKLRPLTGSVSDHPFEALPRIATRAREILRGRTEDQIKGASDTIEYFIKEYFQNAEANYIEGLLRNGGFPLEMLDEEDRNEHGIRYLIDSWPPGGDEPKPFIPDDENTSDLEALQNCIDGYVLEDDVELPDGKDFEYFAVLALWKVEEVQELYDIKGFNHHERMANAAIEAMESICLAELLKHWQKLTTANDNLRFQLKQFSHSHEQDVDSKVRERISLKAAKLAKSGGDGKAIKFKFLETKTIELYLAGTEKNAMKAAYEIAPKIVAMSKKYGGDLVSTTTKPLEWIRAYNRASKANKSNPS